MCNHVLNGGIIVKYEALLKESSVLPLTGLFVVVRWEKIKVVDTIPNKCLPIGMS